MVEGGVIEGWLPLADPALQAKLSAVPLEMVVTGVDIIAFHSHELVLPVRATVWCTLKAEYTTPASEKKIHVKQRVSLPLGKSKEVEVRVVGLCSVLRRWR